MFVVHSIPSWVSCYGLDYWQTNINENEHYVLGTCYSHKDQIALARNNYGNNYYLNNSFFDELKYILNCLDVIKINDFFTKYCGVPLTNKIYENNNITLEIIIRHYDYPCSI